MLEKQRMQAMYRNLADGGVLFVKQRIQAALRYYKSHIWIEITASVLLISAVLLLIFYFYLRSQYYRHLISETEKSDEVVLSAASNSLNNQFSGQLHIGGEIAVNNELYDAVHSASGDPSQMTSAVQRRLKNELSRISHYSDDIAALAVVTKDGLLYEYGRYWNANGLPELWSGENLDVLNEIYDAIMQNISTHKAGHYQVMTKPAWREALPQMNVYHIGFPLIGTYSSLSRVEAVIVVTYRMENIARTSALLSDDIPDYTDRYLTDDRGTIIFHSDPGCIGLSETDYLSSAKVDVVSKPLAYFGWNVHIAIDREAILQKVNSIYSKSALVFMLAIIIAFSVWAILLRSILRPIDTVKRAMENIEQGKQEKVEIRGEHEVWLLAAEYNRMLDALRERDETVQKEYREKEIMSERRIQAERTALESQINAHFIFNTLNAIHYNVLDSGDTETAGLIKRLSNILRYTLSQKTEVTIGSEFDMALQYLYLQKYRLMDKFDYEIDFPEEYGEWPCCKLFLQPFIENSIVHGFEAMDSGGMIRVNGYEEHGRFCVVLEDNGRGMTGEEQAYVKDSLRGKVSLELSPENRGIAIRNVLMRARMFFGPDFDAELESEPGKGTTFTFHLPIPENSGNAEREGN